VSTISDPDEQRESNGREPIAIIGMGCLFPGAPDLDTYWRNIVQGKDCITDPPPEAWDAGVFYDPESTSNDRVYCKRGGYIGPLAYFDPAANGIMPRAVDGGEPDQWLALEAARAALSDAGYRDEIPERERTAVILGKGTYLNRGNVSVVQHGRVVDQTLEILQSLRPDLADADLETVRAELKACLPPFNADTAPSLIPNMVSGRIANRLNLMGPNYTVDAACASSLIAVDHASRGLRNGEFDLALVGGVHVATPVPTSALFCQLGALSRQEQIRPFDKSADGTMLGGGVGIVVLKRLADARRDGNRIYATVRGVGTSSDGRGLSVTAPRVEGEILALRRAYEVADVMPDTIGLVEAHGTGTPVGDATEVQALHRVFGPPDGSPPRCALGSVKSMISHLMPAAGIAGLIKVALALHHKVLPPTLNVVEPNPELELEKTSFYLNTETRPWIHGHAGAPRRGAVNSFGFGGCNAHAILEEHDDAHAASATAQSMTWDSEVCIFSAASRPALIERLSRVREFLDGAEPEVALADLAFTLNSRRDGSCCASIVSSDVDDLKQKLQRTIERLADPNCRKIQDVQGIYFFEDPGAASGRKAFLFPGEGSQYVNMRADLCLHFPEVRRSFDRMDGIFAGHERRFVPSDFIFPRPAFSDAERRTAEERLWQMEGAFESVVTTSWALFTLLDRLEIRPDALLGHSTGEYTAMIASGMIELGDESRITQFVTELNRFYYSEMALEEGIPHGLLLAVGADRETVASVAREAGGEVHVAMDNCPHQTVLAGAEEPIARCVDELQRRGLIYERLSFDRPYHTPLFGSCAGRMREFLSRWIDSAPAVPTYSCTEIAPFPTDLEQVRDVAVRHWLQPVEFRRTIEKMYEDGVRVFVEGGPRGNLSAFVGDILRGRPHLAIPVNVASRSGTSQLNHLVGLLAAQGLPLETDYLYARRSPRTLDLEPNSASRADEAAARRDKASRRLKLKTDWIRMELSEETAKRLRPQVVAEPSVPEHVPAPAPVPAPSTDVDGVLAAHLQTMERFLEVQQDVMQSFLAGREAAPTLPDAVDDLPVAPPPIVETVRAEPPQPSVPIVAAADAPPAEAPDVAALLLDLVSDRTGYPIEMLGLDLDLEADLGIDSIKRVEILGTFQQRTSLLQESDMEALSSRRTLREIIAFLSDRGGGAAHDSPAAAAPAAMPLIDKVISIDDGRKLVASCRLDVSRQRFLRDHALGRAVSVHDPELCGLPVMPLTMSMELLAEAASLLMPGLRLTGMRDIRGYRWIAVERDEISLRVVAERRDDGDGREVFVRILDGIENGNATAPQGEAIVEGTMVFADAYPTPPMAEELVLEESQPSSWTAERLYREVMFHGPSFRGVVSMERCGRNGAEATIEALPTEGLLASAPTPAFVTDPVLLDQPGQVVGFWMAERQEKAYVVFPFHLEALHFYGPNPAAGERFGCRARIEVIGEQVRSDLDVVQADGRLRVRFEGWKDRRFDLPKSFLDFLQAPKDVMLSEAWPLGANGEQERVRLHRLRLQGFPPGFFSAHGAIWQRVLAGLILGRRERDSWRELRAPEARRIEWLLGRLVAKDALRTQLRERHGIELCPADIEILADEHGRPVPQGAWTKQIDRTPLLSLSHSAGVAVAAVTDVDAGEGVGVDIEHVAHALGDGESLALAPAEQELLAALPGSEREGWTLRFWCAKEAVGKALGQGLVAGPRGVIIERLEADNGTVHARLSGAMAERFREFDGTTVVAHTRCDEDLIVATSVAPAIEGRGDPR